MLSASRSLARSPVAVALVGLGALETLFAILWRLGNLKLYVIETIAAGLAAGVIYLVVLYLLEHSAEHRATFWLVLAGAVLFRLTLFPLAPTLSTDIYRYRWDGRIQAETRWNPYRVRPDDPRLANLRDPYWVEMPGRDIATVYPPLSELVFRATYRVLPGPVGFKLPCVLADLVVVALLAGWIRASGGRAFQLAIYAWNPLVVVEFAASGHNDALALAAVVAAALVIIRWRSEVSMLLLTTGALVKAFPAVLVPLWLRRAGWSRRAGQGWSSALAAAALAALCAWPFRSAWPQILDTLDYYQSRWHHNNASLYALLAWWSGSRDVAAGIGVGVVAGLALWAAAQKMDRLRAAYILFGTILMLAPNAYPWYFTWMVPLLCFFPNPAWLLLTVLEFLSYHVLIDYQASGLWRFRTEMLWLTYAPFYALLIWQTVRGGTRKPLSTEVVNT